MLLGEINKIVAITGGNMPLATTTGLKSIKAAPLPLKPGARTVLAPAIYGDRIKAAPDPDSTGFRKADIAAMAAGDMGAEPLPAKAGA